MVADTFDNRTPESSGIKGSSAEAAQSRLIHEAVGNPVLLAIETPNPGKGGAAPSELRLPKSSGEYAKDGKEIPLYTFEDTMPTTSRSWDAKTGVLKDSYPASFGIKDPTKEYGGVLVGEDTSRTIARREEIVTKDGKPGKVIEIKDMEGFRGYGKSLGIAGDRKLDSVTMWQVEKGRGADGKPIYESFKKPVIFEHDWMGNPKKIPKAQATETMSNAEFNKRWAELDPKLLEKIGTQRPSEKGRAI